MKVSRCLIGLGVACLLALAYLPFGCQRPTDSTPPPSEEPAPTEPPWFEDVTDQVGLSFLHDAGPVGDYFLPQLMGSGAALFDFDGDGRLDIYLIQNAGPNSPSRNCLLHQCPDRRFENVSAGSGLDVAGYGMGVAIGDVNNDGRPDVLLTEYGRVRLFLNDGNGHFTEASAKLGRGSSLWGTSACFFDYDRDGWLDLVVTNYVAYDPSWPWTDASGKRDFCGPDVYQGAVTTLYHNLGRDRDGRWLGFQDVTLESGLGNLRGPGLGVVCADFDGDGWPDIFVANDKKPNHLWMNQGNGTFREEGIRRGLAYDILAQAPANMGIAVGDVDGDGFFDIYVTHLALETNALWKQGPERGHFQDRTAAMGLAAAHWRGTGFGTAFGDFDNAGALDLAVVNGAVVRNPTQAASSDATPFWSRYGQRNQLLANDGTGHFRDVSLGNRAFCGTPGVYRGLTVGDIDNDGSLDLLVTQVSGRARLFRNIAPKHGHWLMVSALDPRLGGRDAYGAEVTVYAGKRHWRRWLNPGYSYLCSNDPRVHFGLGQADQVDAVRVLWPDGLVEEFPGQGVDRWLRLKRGQGLKSQRQFGEW